jgi:hypothetical protein
VGEHGGDHVRVADLFTFAFHVGLQSLQAVRHPGVLGQEGGPLSDRRHVAHRVRGFQAETVLIGGPGCDGEILAQDPGLDGFDDPRDMVG